MSWTSITISNLSRLLIAFLTCSNCIRYICCLYSAENGTLINSKLSNSSTLIPSQQQTTTDADSFGSQSASTPQLEKYFWERVYESSQDSTECPLNCTAHSLQCWRLAGYAKCMNGIFSHNFI